MSEPLFFRGVRVVVDHAVAQVNWGCFGILCINGKTDKGFCDATLATRRHVPFVWTSSQGSHTQFPQVTPCERQKVLYVV